MSTKEELLKTDPALKNRPYQIEALLSIFLYAKCLVKMFCGTGKSTIITNVIIHEKKELSVVVFPSLALISQYSADYLNNDKYKKHFKKHKTMNVSSESLTTIVSTTSPKEIKKFLNLKIPKIILVTYQSYQVLLDCLEGKKIGLVCYDEAHHVTSPETQKLVFGTDYFEKEVFFTATPKNENGITMFDRDDPEKNMCGPIAYDYTYLQGLTEGYLNAFEICIDMYTENTNNSIYKAIARAILTKGTSRCLSFHSGVNGESNTNVWNFIKADAFKTAFEKVLKDDFPEKADYYKKITLKGMDGNTPAAERKRMLLELDETPDDEIYLIGSCETIGEGVDTKKANMCIFADPKSSITKIIQNIGRVVRPNAACPLSTILIPCWVNMENYAEAQGDRVKQDELIRQQMRSEKGDYACILNVLGALKQEDPELYEMCLNYPNRNVKEESLNEQGFMIVEEDDTETYTPDEVQEMKDGGEMPLEIHTNEAIERFNEDVEDEPLTRLYYDEEENIFKPIVSISDADTSDAYISDTESVGEEDDRQIIQPPKPKAGIKTSIHQNDVIQMLWGVKGELDFSKKFCSVVIDCEVVKFDPMEVATKIVAFVKEKGQMPKNFRGITTLTNEEIVEKIYANKLNYWKQCVKGTGHGVKIRSDVCEYLDKELPGWRDEINNEENALSYAKEIVNYVKQKNNDILPKRCDKKNAIDNRTQTQIIENKYACKLSTWRMALKNFKVGMTTCPKIVSEYLDLELPNWREEINLEERAINKAKEIVNWIKTINNGNLPKMYGGNIYLNKQKIILTEEQNVENNLGRKLSMWRMALNTELGNTKKRKIMGNKCDWKCCNKVRDFLDKEIPEWRFDIDKKLLEKAKEIVLFVKTKLDGKFPQAIKTPKNDDEEIERQYALTLTNWKVRPNEKVLKYLNKEMPGWNDTLDDKAMDYAKEIVEYVRNTLNGSLPRHFFNKVLDGETIEERKKEGKYSTKLSNWKDALNGSKNSICSLEVRDYLDKEIPGWRADRIVKQNMEKAREIVNFVNTVLNGKLPQQFQKKMPDIRTKEQIQEHKYAGSLIKIKKNLKNGITIVSDCNIVYLDKELPGWRPIELPPVEVIAPLPKKRTKKTLIILPDTTDEETSAATTTPHHFAPISAIGLLHKTYLKMRSDTLHHKFKAEPQLWREYHATRKQNFAAYDPASIPANQIIQELEKIQTKRRKVVVDMGCGEAPIAHHFLNKNDNRFTFNNYDHQSGGDSLIQEVDISALPLEDASADIAIMSLALWGTQENCIQYIKEAYRVLESKGTFYIIDSTKKWSPEPLTAENKGQHLCTLLTENGFKNIVNKDTDDNVDSVSKFCLFECTKI